MKNITEILNIKYPIIQGGMANIALAELAAAVSNAGGMGVIGSGGWNGERLREEIIKTRKLTDKDFAVNIMLLNPNAKELSKVCIEEGIKVIITGAGSPARYIKEWKENNITVIPVVPSTKSLLKLEKKYTDYIDGYVIEGTEAGGHIGELTTMISVPQAVRATKKPIIAAGGIATPEQVVASFALGAKGIQVGTLFLAAEECPIHNNYKDKIITADSTDTVVTGRIKGFACRIIGNNMSKDFIELEKTDASIHDLEKLTLGSLRKAVLEGDIDNGSVMAGQSIGLINEIKSTKKIIEELFISANKIAKEIEVI